MQNKNPFLSIVTRTCNRPNLLKICTDSVKAQTDQDLEQLFIIDEIGRGKVWAQASLNEYKDKLNINGKYVMVLDDDDFLVDLSFVEVLKNTVGCSSPDIIFFRGLLGNKLYPPDELWEKPPVHARICTFCFAVKKDFYMRFIHKWAQRDSGDFHFIRACFNASKNNLWINRAVAKAQKISRGVPGE